MPPTSYSFLWSSSTVRRCLGSKVSLRKRWMMAVLPTPAAPRNTRRTSVLSFTSIDMVGGVGCLVPPDVKESPLVFLLFLLRFPCGSLSVMELGVGWWQQMHVPVRLHSVFMFSDGAFPLLLSANQEQDISLSLCEHKAAIQRHWCKYSRVRGGKRNRWRRWRTFPGVTANNTEVGLIQPLIKLIILRMSSKQTCKEKKRVLVFSILV